MALTNEDLNAIAQSMDTKLDVRLKPINERFNNLDTRFDKMDARLDKMDELFDKMDELFDNLDERFDKMDKRLDKMEARFDKMDTRLAVIEHKEDRTAKKLEDLRIDAAIAEKKIKRDIFELKDEMEIVIEILKMHELIP